MDIALSLLPNQKYLVAVSGGSDSMALLDLLRQGNYPLIVAHVNYKKRISSDRDQRLVEEYCTTYNIPLYTLVNHEKETGNFQAWARQFRYHFFHKIYQQEHCDALLVAHQKSDYLETYFMKKKRHSLADDFGIPSEISLYGMKVLRPLMAYYKEDLLQYCQQNHVPFGVDETNFSRKYQRNVVRMDILDKMTRQEKDALYLKIQDENQHFSMQKQRIQQRYKQEVHHGQFSLSTLQQMSPWEQQLFLYTYLMDHKIKSSSRVSKRLLEELLSSLFSDKPNITIKLGVKTIVKSYNNIYLDSNEEVYDYEYVVSSLDKVTSPYFIFNGDEGEEFSVSRQDFPLTIRNTRPNDSILIKTGHKKLRRFFIDEKVPRSLRRKIPLVLTCKGEIVFIPHLYKNKDRNLLQTDRIVLKLKSLTQA